MSLNPTKSANLASRANGEKSPGPYTNKTLWLYFKISQIPSFHLKKKSKKKLKMFLKC